MKCCKQRSKQRNLYSYCESLYAFNRRTVGNEWKRSFIQQPAPLTIPNLHFTYIPWNSYKQSAWNANIVIPILPSGVAAQAENDFLRVLSSMFIAHAFNVHPSILEGLNQGTQKLGNKTLCHTVRRNIVPQDKTQLIQTGPA